MMKNPYKRTDIFICNYEAHARFGNHVSAYHVMRQKKCYPQGCIMFRWSCSLKDKGKSCVRGYNYVGRLCDGCSHYQDEKLNHQPSVNVSKQEFEAFLLELEEFDDWVEEHHNRDLSIWCEIDTIKPRFVKYVNRNGGQFRLEGYLLIIRHGFIGQTEFDDFFYIHISPHQQDRLRLAPGDRFDVKGRFTLDRGRVLFNKIWHIDFEERSGNLTWNNSRALVARQTAVRFQKQYENCIHCPNGALVDVNNNEHGKQQHFRELYCFMGVQDPESCYIHASRLLENSLN